MYRVILDSFCWLTVGSIPKRTSLRTTDAEIDMSMQRAGVLSPLRRRCSVARYGAAGSSGSSALALHGAADGRSAARGEMLVQPRGVKVLPAIGGPVARVLLVQADQQVGKLAAHWPSPEHVWQ